MRLGLERSRHPDTLQLTRRKYLGSSRIFLVPRSQVGLGNALVLEVALPLPPEPDEVQLRGHGHSQVQLGNEGAEGSRQKPRPSRSQTPVWERSSLRNSVPSGLSPREQSSPEIRRSQTGVWEREKGKRYPESNHVLGVAGAAGTGTPASTLISI
jgi:hypothetical protein